MPEYVSTPTQSCNETRISRDTSDDYIRRIKEKLLNGYRSGESKELKEPNWTESVEWGRMDNRERARTLELRGKWCYYELIGECYVHDMMDGEAIALQNRNMIPAEVFELR